MSKKTCKYAVFGANNVENEIFLNIFDTKEAAFNYMKKDACGVAEGYDEEFTYMVSEDTGKCTITSRKKEYEELQHIWINKNDAEVLTSFDDRYWWQIRKIPA